jgi:hypothetical protein
MERSTMGGLLLFGVTALLVGMSGIAMPTDDRARPSIAPQKIQDDGGLMVRPRALENATARCPEGTPSTATTVTLLLDADVFGYANPRVIVKPSGSVPAGVVVCLVESKPDNRSRPGSWYHLQGDNVPNGDGWIYSGPDYQSLPPS